MRSPSPICKNCVNFIMDGDEYCSCDYEYWTDVHFLTAVLNTPEMFGCIEFEYSPEIREYVEE